jgi:serine/threonine-protein kinase
MTIGAEGSSITSKFEKEYLFKPENLIAERYEVIEALGRGGFSEVYHCFDTHLGREVAVKVLIKGEAGLKEARSAARLKHKNIVNVYEVPVINQGYPLIIFEYISGETLEKRLSDVKHQRLPLNDSTLKIVQQIAEALDYAHKQKIVHRDVKPSNVIIDLNGEAHLTDFGLAEVKLPEEQRASMMTSEVKSRLSGTIPYMSPEQLINENMGDEKSDQYSLGVVAYEMLTGRLPFPGHDSALMIQIATMSPQPPTSINPEIPKGVELVLLKTLSKKPEDRYGSCIEFSNKITLAADQYLKAAAQYEEAIQIFDNKQWRAALAAFESLTQRAPGFKETEAYLEKTKQQVRLLDLYERAKQQVEQGTFQEALTTLDILMQIDPNYDITALRVQVVDGQSTIERKSLDDLYQQAVQQYRSGQYDSSVNLLNTIHKRNPEYPDRENIETDVRKLAQQQRELHELYAKGVELRNLEQWNEALAMFDVLKTRAPKYPDVDNQLASTRYLAKLSVSFHEALSLLDQGKYAASIDEARRLQDKDDTYKKDEVASLIQNALNGLHSQVAMLINGRQYEDGQKALNELEARSKDFADIGDLRSQINEGIRKTELKVSLEGYYQQAIEDIKQHEYQQAFDVWKSIQQQKEDLDIPDPQNVEAQARGGLAGSLYSQATMALAQNEPQLALKLWQQIQEVDRNFPDRQQIVRGAQSLQQELPNKDRQNETGDRAQRKKLMRWAFVIGGGLVGVIALVVLISIFSGSRPAANTPTPSIIAPTTTLTIVPATDVPTLSPTQPPVDTPTAATPTSGPTTPITNIAIALLPSSIYELSGTSSCELAYIKSGEQVTVLGRALSDSWLYIQNSNGTAEGYVSRNRFQWAGDINTLQIITRAGSGICVSTNTATPSIPLDGTAKPLEGLTFDLWTLPKTAKCLPNNQWEISVFMSGHGGSGMYTYYWNGEYKGGPTASTNFTFELIVSGTGRRIQGVGRATSTDGQQRESTLLVNVPVCP